MATTLIDRVVSLGFDKEIGIKLIRTGKVYINDQEEILPNVKVQDTDEIKIHEPKVWVSRGALKINPIIDEVNLDLQGKVVLDVGSSTGGFTQAALKKGADFVYALDSGTNQLDYSLRINKNVLSMENTNIKDATKKMFKRKIDVVLVDVSFISLEHVFKSLKNIVSKKTKVLALIKPQFEARKEDVEKGGYVPVEKHAEIIDKTFHRAANHNFTNLEIHESPIKGKKANNIEYFALFERVK